MEIVNEFRNELLKRREIRGFLNSEGNPGFDEVVKQMSARLKVSEEQIVVNNLKNNFGSGDFFVEAMVYDSLNDKMRIEPQVKAKKSAGGEK